jgi:hypothetical protein
VRVDDDGPVAVEEGGATPQALIHAQR